MLIRKEELLIFQGSAAVLAEYCMIECNLLNHITKKCSIVRRSKCVVEELEQKGPANWTKVRAD